MINVFPPLYEIGQNMCANFMNWGDRRKMEISNDEKMTDEVRVSHMKITKIPVSKPYSALFV
jgi:hypothetical protein